MARISIFFLTILIIGCTTIYNPATQKKEFYFIDDNSEILIGRNLALQFLSENKVLKDERLLSFVREIGEKVSKVSDRSYLPYHFYVLDYDDINAFALPGGYIFINKGLVDKTDTDGLAFVLGHEIAHVCARHSIKRLQVSLGLNLLLGLALGDAKHADLRKGIDIIYNIIALGYSRQDEFLADSLGVTYAQKAGFSPYGAITVLNKLKEEGEKDYRLVFLRSHPPLEERIINVRRKIEELQAYFNTGGCEVVRGFWGKNCPYFSRAPGLVKKINGFGI